AGDGTPCDDGDDCSANTICIAGECGGGTEALASGSPCDDHNPCTYNDYCLNGTCVGDVFSDGFPGEPPCDDGNACTRLDVCLSGQCAGLDPVTCVASDQCHDPGTCNPATGACSNPPKADGAACDDGNQCTVNDACQSGSCVGTNRSGPCTDGN